MGNKTCKVVLEPFRTIFKTLMNHTNFSLIPLKGQIWRVFRGVFGGYVEIFWEVLEGKAEDKLGKKHLHKHRFRTF